MESVVRRAEGEARPVHACRLRHPGALLARRRENGRGDCLVVQGLVVLEGWTGSGDGQLSAS